MKCCDQEELTTPFCPHCGKRAELPLLTLLAHIQKGRNAYAKNVESFASFAKDHPSSSRSKKLVSQRKNLAKWDSWVGALQTVINKESGE